MTGQAVAGGGGATCAAAARGSRRDVSLSTVTPSDTADSGSGALSQAPSSDAPPTPARSVANQRLLQRASRKALGSAGSGSDHALHPGPWREVAPAPASTPAAASGCRCFEAALAALRSFCQARATRRSARASCGRPGRRSVGIVDGVREEVARRGAGGVTQLLLRQDPARSVDRAYTSVRDLGTGSFGSVREVMSVATGEHRALKLLDKAPNVNSKQDLRTELHALLRLDHPNVVRLCEFFEHRRYLYVVTELCEGGDFSQLMSGPCPRQELRLLFKDVTAGIAYCHARGVAHRDIKFANCLLAAGASRRVGKVIDFGLAAMSLGDPEDFVAQGRCGTYLFMAPEVLDGSPYGPRCDVWSLGVMLFMILTRGEHPFARDPARCDMRRLLADACCSRVRSEALAAATRDDFGAFDVALGLLTRDPVERLDAAAALEHPWLQAPETETEEARQEMEAQTRELLRRLLAFAELPASQRAARALAARGAPAAAADAGRAAFLALDRRRAGGLSRQDLAEGLAAHGWRGGVAASERALAGADLNGSGRVEWAEWLAATLPTEVLQGAGVAREAFDLLRRGGRGVRDCELRSIVCGEALPPSNQAKALEFEGFLSLLRDASRPRGQGRQ